MLSPQEPDQLVFVYGTLRRGGSNAFRMDGAEFVSPGRIEGSLYKISWYPGLVPGEGTGWVKGDIFKVGPGQLRALDEFEGLSAGEIEGSEYRRVEVPVWLEDGRGNEPLLAWAYRWIGPIEERNRVLSGDWLERQD